MTQATSATQSSLTGSGLYIAFDMGRDSLQFAASDGGKTKREVKIVRTDLDVGKTALLDEIAKARKRFRLPDDAPVYAVYEAGRDGFWLARWLEDAGNWYDTDALAPGTQPPSPRELPPPVPQAGRLVTRAEKWAEEVQAWSGQWSAVDVARLSRAQHKRMVAAVAALRGQLDGVERALTSVGSKGDA